MYFVFFALWVVFNARLTWEIAIFGAALSGLLYAFCCAFLGYGPKKDLAAVKRVPRMLRYAGVLVCEIIKSNIALTKIVLNRKIEVKPRLITFQTPLTGPIAKCVLANSITVTPGTITVLSQGDSLTVHCLDQGFGEGIEDLKFQRLLTAMQEEGREHDA